MIEYVVLGPENSGKTALIRRIIELSNGIETCEMETLGTISTLGVESSVPNDNPNITIREIGSSFINRWESYIPYCKGFVYVIDCSDLGSLSTAIVIFYEILISTDVIKDKIIALVLNKLEMCDKSNLLVINNFLRLDEILITNEKITLFRGDCTSYTLSKELKEWMYSHE